MRLISLLFIGCICVSNTKASNGPIDFGASTFELTGVTSQVFRTDGKLDLNRANAGCFLHTVRPKHGDLMMCMQIEAVEILDNMRSNLRTTQKPRNFSDQQLIEADKALNFAGAKDLRKIIKLGIAEKGKAFSCITVFKSAKDSHDPVDMIPDKLTIVDTAIGSPRVNRQQQAIILIFNPIKDKNAYTCSVGLTENWYNYEHTSIYLDLLLKTLVTGIEQKIEAIFVHSDNGDINEFLLTQRQFKSYPVLSEGGSEKQLYAFPQSGAITELNRIYKLLTADPENNNYGCLGV